MCAPEEFLNSGWRALRAVAGVTPRPLFSRHSRQKILAPHLQRPVDQVEVDAAIRSGVWGKAVDFLAVLPKH